jgi:hypothetical protein
MPAGEHWDAVRLRPDMAGPVYRSMCEATCGDPGPVLLAASARHFWLVRPGGTQDWTLPGVVCLGSGAWITPVHGGRTQEPGPHWLIPPSPDGRLAPSALLHAVIRSVVGG